MLSAARIDLATLLVHLAATNVFGAHATCNRLETVARRSAGGGGWPRLRGIALPSV